MGEVYVESLELVGFYHALNNDIPAPVLWIFTYMNYVIFDLFGVVPLPFVPLMDT